MKLFIGLTMLFSVTNVYAASLNKECLGEVVSAVNTHHTMAEGAVFALRVLHEGDFSSSILVGHSDETDPTDYLVTVVHQANECKVKTITVASEASNVVEYSKADEKLASDAYEARKKVITQLALQLMDKVPSSGYDVRLLCVVGDKVIARVPMTHWSANDRKTMSGTLKNFSAKPTAGEPKISITSKKGVLLTGTEHDGMFEVAGYVNNRLADICIVESKPVLE